MINVIIVINKQMAIKGDFIFKKYIETGTEEVTTIVPEDIPETDPRYDDRGKEVTFQKPTGEVVDDPDETYINHVLAINSCGLHAERPQVDNKIWNVAIIYAIYENEEDRLHGRNIVKYGDLSRWDGIDFNDVESSPNIYEFCYNYLKQEDWVTNATDI
ncbi:MAG: hypothetical protein CMJ05_01630 [Pelagibacterales bacterium]|nr:hypothetical protein [Pelagibacterales bacterium]